MPRKLEAYVEEILRSVAEIESFVVGQDFSTYCDDIKTKAAVERKLLNIGEALNQANQLDKNIEIRIKDFRKIVGFRNILVHGYFGIDDALVWDILTTKLKQLKLDIVAL